jgi:hypothetical protein
MKITRTTEFHLTLKRKKAFLNVTLAILLLAEAVISQTTPQAAIADSAAEYGLGRPRAESLHPLQTPAPHSEGWWQAFERGWVYWHPRYGARVVKGKIFEAWGGQRWEQGSMGFPNGSETNCPSPDARDLYQSFEGGKIYWNAATNRATVFTSAERFGESGKCFAPARGRFRVTLNGFTCNRQASDNPLAQDGADDEVFLFTKVFSVEKRLDSNDVTFSLTGRIRTEAIGDTSSTRFPGRVRGGSSRRLGANGGFRAGDSFPESPEKHTTNPQRYTLPQLIWEGDLIRRQNAVVIIPTIWEWDGVSNLFDAWEHADAGQVYTVGGLISNSNSTDQSNAKLSIRGEVTGQLSMRTVSLPADRPIGMFQDSFTYHFRPEVFILTYDEALRMVQLSQSKGGEAFPFTYEDAAGLGGRYTLYLQVEHLPN